MRPNQIEDDEEEEFRGPSKSHLKRVQNELQELGRVMTGMGEVVPPVDDLHRDLTRLRAQLYRIQQQAAEGSPEALQLDEVIGETDTLMARFRGLLRISELEDRQRRSGFVELDPAQLLEELHEFYLPLAEEGDLRFQLNGIVIKITDIVADYICDNLTFQMAQSDNLRRHDQVITAFIGISDADKLAAAMQRHCDLEQEPLPCSHTMKFPRSVKDR